MTLKLGNWNTPQEVRLSGCAPAETSLTFRVKAKMQGGFKGTEKDELTTLINQLKKLRQQAQRFLSKPKTPAKPEQFIQRIKPH